MQSTKSITAAPGTQHKSNNKVKASQLCEINKIAPHDTQHQNLAVTAQVTKAPSQPHWDKRSPSGEHRDLTKLKLTAKPTTNTKGTASDYSEQTRRNHFNHRFIGFICSAIRWCPPSFLINAFNLLEYAGVFSHESTEDASSTRTTSFKANSKKSKKTKRKNKPNIEYKAVQAKLTQSNTKSTKPSTPLEVLHERLTRLANEQHIDAHNSGLDALRNRLMTAANEKKIDITPILELVCLITDVNSDKKVCPPQKCIDLTSLDTKEGNRSQAEFFTQVAQAAKLLATSIDEPEETPPKIIIALASLGPINFKVKLIKEIDNPQAKALLDLFGNSLTDIEGEFGVTRFEAQDHIYVDRLINFNSLKPYGRFTESCDLKIQKGQEMPFSDPPL